MAYSKAPVKRERERLGVEGNSVKLNAFGFERYLVRITIQQELHL